MPSDLTSALSEIEKLKRTIAELEQTSKMLVQRDIDLRKAYDSLKALDREKSEFISIAAHQLRTPLTAIRFANQMLTESIQQQLSESQVRTLQQATYSIDLMFKMIEDLLMVDALDYGSVKLERAPVVIEDILSSIVSELAELAGAKGLLLHTAFATERSTVYGDQPRLHDALSNIIDNAVKYTPEGGTIDIATTYTPTHLTITVSDSGIGIVASESDRIFKKFSRLENAKRVDANGSGLGLYITKKIVEAHKGTVSFTANEPTGTCFIVTLPI